MYVFLSYSRDDTEHVEAVERLLVQALARYGLQPWRDVWELRPGLSWQPQVVSALKASRVVVAFLGPGKLDGAQEREVQKALSLQMERELPVIPVLLPKARDVREAGTFLEQNTWVDFRSGIPARPEHSIEFGRLIYGITGDRTLLQQARALMMGSPPPGLPGDAAVPPGVPGGTAVNDEAESLARKAAADLEPYLRDENITFFIGTGAAPRPLPRPDALQAPPARKNGAPAVRLLSRTLLSELRFIPRPRRAGGPEPSAGAAPVADTGTALAIPRRRRPGAVLPGIDVAGEYYIAKNTARLLEDRMRQELPDRLEGISPTYRNLAVLAALLAMRPTPRGQIRARQLVVSTAYDVLLECALVLAGVPFTRIVQYRSGQQVQVDRFGAGVGSVPARGTPAQVREQLLRAFDEARTPSEGVLDWLDRAREDWSVVKLGGHVARLDFPDGAFLLYKLAGSADVKDSCAISTDQMFSLGIEQQKAPFIPAQVLDAVADTAVVFLGYWPLDPDLRLAMNLFQEQLSIKEKERILVPYWPRGRESRIRPDLVQKAATRLGRMQLVDDRPQRFVERLAERTVEIL